jgi:hypothetical protein
MHRFRTPELFLGCFLTVAVFSAGMLFVNWPYANQPTQQISAAAPKSDSNERQAERNEPSGWLPWLFKDAAGFFTFGLAAIGVGQAMLFFIQLRYMRSGMDDAAISASAAKEAADTAKIQAEVARDTLKTMQDTAERQLRAYVFVESAQVINVVDGSGSPEAHVVIKNYGQTPAYELVNVSGFAMDQYPSPPTLSLIINDADFGIGSKTAMALGPGACLSLSRPVKDPPSHQKSEMKLSTGLGLPTFTERSDTRTFLVTNEPPNIAS